MAAPRQNVEPPRPPCLRDLVPLRTERTIIEAEDEDPTPVEISNNRPMSNGVFGLIVMGLRFTIPMFFNSETDSIILAEEDAKTMARYLRRKNPRKIYRRGTLGDQLLALTEETAPAFTMDSSNVDTVPQPTIIIYADPISCKHFFKNYYSGIDPARAIGPEVADEIKISIIIPYYLSAVFTLFPTLLTTIMETQHSLGLTIELNLEHCPLLPGRDEAANSTKIILDEALLLLAYLAKPIVGEPDVNWFQRRRRAMYKQTTTTPVDRTASILIIKEYWNIAGIVKKLIVTYFLNPNIIPDVSPLKDPLTQLVPQCRMLWEWGELKTFQISYYYINKRPALLTNTLFIDQAKIVKDTFEKLKRDHPEDYPYSKLLGYVTNECDVSHYPDVATAAIIHMRSINKTWEKYQEPRHQTSVPIDEIRRLCNTFMQRQ